MYCEQAFMCCFCCVVKFCCLHWWLKTLIQLTLRRFKKRKLIFMWSSFTINTSTLFHFLTFFINIYSIHFFRSFKLLVVMIFSFVLWLANLIIVCLGQVGLRSLLCQHDEHAISMSLLIVSIWSFSLIKSTTFSPMFSPLFSETPRFLHCSSYYTDYSLFANGSNFHFQLVMSSMKLLLLLNPFFTFSIFTSTSSVILFAYSPQLSLILLVSRLLRAFWPRRSWDKRVKEVFMKTLGEHGCRWWHGRHILSYWTKLKHPSTKIVDNDIDI